MTDFKSGDIINSLEFLCYTNPYINSSTGKRTSRIICLCLCCGKYWIGLAANVKCHNTKTCGRCNEVKIGDIFNWLEILCWTIPYNIPKTGYKSPRVICFCHGCGSYWIGLESSVKKGDTKSCGCYRNKQVGDALTGRKHHNWKGGITPLCEQIRKHPRLNVWKQKIRERDNYTCQYSGELGRLEVHHKKPFHIILEENKITTLEQALACEELWDIENGVTLLRKFHKIFHVIYGYNCRIVNFKEWMKKRPSYLYSSTAK